jgi:hypothetical protein
MRSALGVEILIASVWLSACAGTQPTSKTAPTESATGSQSDVASIPAPPEPVRVLPELHSGALEPVLGEGLSGKVIAHAVNGETETFEVALSGEALSELQSPWVVFEPDGRGPASFFQWNRMADEAPHLWLRRRIPAAASGRLQVELLSSGGAYEPARRYHLDVAVPARAARNKKLNDEYLAALAGYLEGTSLGALLAGRKGDTLAGSYSYTDWSSLMRLTTGYDSVQSALLANETLRASADPAKATVPLSSLTPPRVESHPWQRMLAALPAGKRPTEALAGVTPRDFYFVRASGFSELQAVLDEADRWITQAVRLAREGGRRYDLADRYRGQLGLRKSELLKVFGPKLVKEAALVGSDPFVRQGSDVSLLLRTSDAQALINALNSKLAVDYPSGVSRSSFAHAGVTVTESRTPDGELRQFVAQLPQTTVGPLAIVSNSRGAIVRIIDVASAGTGALSDEPDFRYMLARDASVPADVLAYLGDAFVEAAVAPRQRVLDARRQLAGAELSRVAQAALLFAWLEGREPRDTKELMASPWLDKRALRHTDGSAIEFRVGAAPTSVHGSPAFLEPLIDRPTPERVTPAERDAYASFANSYASQWSDRIDPVALRVQVTRAGEGTRFDCHVRILPLQRSSDYRELEELAGKGQVRMKVPLPGAHVTLAIGKDSELRHELSGQGRSFLGKKFGVDWLGDWVRVGLADEPAVASAVQAAGLAPELPEEHDRDDFDVLATLPLYAAIDVARPGAAAMILALLRKQALEAVPDIDWGPDSEHRGTAIVRVRAQEMELFYALTKRRLFVSPDADLVRTLIDTDATTASEPTAQEPGAQLVAELQSRQPSGVLRALGWLIEHELREQSDEDARQAEVLLRGTPQRDAEARERLAKGYLGFVPATPDGKLFELGPLGVTDPVRGSAYRPVYPDLPVPGSPLEALLSAIGKVRVELGFDDEPGTSNQRSLRSRFTLERRE